MKIIQKKISALKIADYNPRKLTEKQEIDLTESVKKFGFTVPVVINAHAKRRNVIVNGHQRVLVAKKLGIKDVPCVEVKLTLEQERELNVRLNKNTGSFDSQKLQLNFNITELLSWGFEKKELDFDAAAAISPKKKKPKANIETQFALGELRFTLPQEIYVRWMDALAKIVGMKKVRQVSEVMRRLKIETGKKK